MGLEAGQAKETTSSPKAEKPEGRSPKPVRIETAAIEPRTNASMLNRRPQGRTTR